MKKMSLFVVVAAAGVLSGSILPAFAQTTVSFEDGVAPTPAYTGTRDVYMRSDEPTTNFGNEDNLRALGGDPYRHTLIKWDVSSIPATATITAASITVNVTNASGLDSYFLYEMLMDWVEGTNASGSGADWNTYDGAIAWPGGAGGRGGQGANNGGVILGTMSTAAVGSYTFNLNANGIAEVQDWVDVPGTNYGVVIMNPLDNDAFQWASREAVAGRPRLTVTYVTPAAPAPPGNEGENGNDSLNDSICGLLGVEFVIGWAGLVAYRRFRRRR